MRPQTLETSNDYDPALLWLMDELGQAKASDVITEFGRRLVDLIPSEHREELETRPGEAKWQNYVRWARARLVQAGLMGSGGHGIWTITEDGRAWLQEHPGGGRAEIQALARAGYQGRKASGRAKTTRRQVSKPPAIELSEEQLLAVKETMPPDRFEALFGDLWQRYQEQRRRSLITLATDPQLLRDARREANQIQDYLLGRSQQVPAPELIANWIVFCYQIKLYREAAALFRQIGPDQIDKALYEHVRKIAQACEVRLK